MSQIQLRHNNRAGVSQKHQYNWAPYILISALTLNVPFQLPATRTQVVADFKRQSQRVAQSYDRIWSMFAVTVDGWLWQQQTRLESPRNGNRLRQLPQVLQIR
jgi:hypothetical protein